jgi:hypothetical protein
VFFSDEFASQYTYIGKDFLFRFAISSYSSIAHCGGILLAHDKKLHFLFTPITRIEEG